MKLLRRWYWLISGIFKKHALGITLSAVLGIVAVILITRYASKLPLQSVSYLGRVGMFNIANLPSDIQQQISYGLTNIGPDSQVQLSAASHMDISPDGKTYTFTLKPGLVWSNQVPFTSQDITLDSPDIITSYPTSNTISFTLKEPYAPFPAIVSLPELKKVTTGKLIKHTNIIGLKSPYISKILTKNQYVTQLVIKSGNQTKIYKFYPTEADAVTAYKLGQVDAIESLTKPYLADWPQTQISQHYEPNRYVALFFNTQNQNLQEKSLRQLLAYATPKGPDSDRVLSPIPKTSWYYNPQVKPYNYSPETAKAMLDKIRETNPQFNPEFTITTTPAYSDMAQQIKSSWEGIGIKTDIKIVPYPDPNDYEILLIGQQVPDDPDQYALWHSTQNTNISHYKSPKIDKLLEDGRKELNPVKRQEIYQEFQRFLVEDSPAAFLYQLKSYDLDRGKSGLTGQ